MAGNSTRFFIGHYKLLKELGRGTMGTVYRAVHPAMSRLVALKVMSRDYLQDRRAIARFQREIRTAAALDHPHIVRALDAGCEKNIHYLVMEHVDGKDLRHWIKAAGPLPVPWSCECVRQAAVGLQHAFERGVIHRDLKPSNLLVLGKSLEGEPKVKIVDFGLARVGEDLGGDVKLTRIGRTVGTWAYIAPEQARDSASADIRSDIFSLGCALFEMVTGALPFKGTSDLDTLMMRLKVDAPRMSTLRSEIDPRLDEIVARMLAREPSQRFQTPAEVAQILASSPHAWKSKPQSRPVRPTPEPETDSKETLCGGTDPEFDRFVLTTPDFSVRSSSVSDSPVRAKADRRPSSWWQITIPAVASLAVLAIAAWALTR